MYTLFFLVVILFTSLYVSSFSPPQLPILQFHYPSARIPQKLSAASERLLKEHKGRLLHCNCKEAPFCDIYICGTLHVSAASVKMVQDVISSLQPDSVVIELCASRADTLFDHDPSVIRLRQVFGHALRTRSARDLGMGLLCWMQSKAARLTHSNLGGEQRAAALAAFQCGSQVVLGDRQYEVTMQRVFDRLNVWSKLQMYATVLLEAMTMRVQTLQSYIKRTEDEVGFAEAEIRQFIKHMPHVAEVIISERDLYLAQSIRNTALLFNNTNAIIVAVVGAGHLSGIRRCLSTDCATEEIMLNISKSSKHAPTWPGKGVVTLVSNQEQLSEIT